MDNIKYENLLERSVKVQEGLLNATNGLSEAVKQLHENTKNLNDKFVLHCQEISKISVDISDIKVELLKYLKLSILALVVILGGQKIVELLISYGA